MLGKQFPVLEVGACPIQLQSPVGKVLPISYIGDSPFIRLADNSGMPMPIGGSEFLVVNVLSKKFKFTPEFKFGEYYSHITTDDGEWLGIVAQVC